MNINYMESVIAVYKFRNYSDAADAMNLSVSALSKQITSIEEELGVKIFNRATRSQALTLTPEGAQLIFDLEDTVEQFYSLKNKVEQLKSPLYNSLRIGYVSTTGSLGESRVISEYYKRYPNVHLQLYLSSAEDLIRRTNVGTLDGFFAVCKSISPEKDLEIHNELLKGDLFAYELIYRSDRMFIGVSQNNRLAKKDLIYKGDIKDETILENHVHKGSSSFLTFVNEKNIRYLDFSLPHVINELVRDDFAILPTEMYLDVREKYPDVKFIQMGDFYESEFCCFIYKRKYQSLHLKRFKECCKIVADVIKLEQSNLCD